MTIYTANNDYYTWSVQSIECDIWREDNSISYVYFFSFALRLYTRIISILKWILFSTKQGIIQMNLLIEVWSTYQ
jgi:hypothetical protein